MLVIVVPCSEGNQKIIHVSDLIIDGEEFFTNGEDDNSLICCVYGNCTCNSLDHALANLTSNVLINITYDVTLSSLIERSGLQNISIIGHNNPTVNCKAGGIHFTFCCNCFIQGITWDGCGSKNSESNAEPGIKVNYSSNLTIQNCTFQHSIGQVLVYVLSKVLGDVNINNCNFENNKHYKGHGAAIHYSYMFNTKKCALDSHVFSINNCNFNKNKYSKSLVYVENKSRRSIKCNKIILNNTKFISNKGISVYVINHKIYINGEVLFRHNTAENGAGIYISDHATVIFDENSNVLFSLNVVDNRGGAIFLSNHSICLFDENCTVTFIFNIASKGGAIYNGGNSNVTFKETYKVTFAYNQVLQCGAAIYSLGNSFIVFGGNTRKKFNSSIVSYNKTLQTNGSIYSLYITFEENCNVVFSYNVVKYGGVIHCENNCNISFEKASTTMFRHNIAYNKGGVIHSHNSRICFEESSTTLFSNNSGAIYSYNNSYISFEGNSITVFSNNVAEYGGAIYSDYKSYIFFKANSFTKFSNNIAVNGGAISSDENSCITFEESSITEFSDNTAYLQCGAISSQCNSCISFEGKSITRFSDNTADAGAAICSHGNSYVSFKGSSVTEFSKNIASSTGGVISSQHNCCVSFQGNSVTTFHDNAAGYDGGAIYSYYNSYISFQGHSAIVFSNNTGGRCGGAIYSFHNSYIYFKGNSSTEFKYNTGDDCLDDLLNSTAAPSAITIFSFNSAVIVQEHSTVVFQNLLVNWCVNVCLPYPSKTMAFRTSIDSNGMVWCNNLNAFNCLSDKCYCKDLEKKLGGVKNNQVVNITDEIVVLSSVIHINSYNVSIIGHNNPTIICVNHSGLKIYKSNSLTIEGITWIGCGATHIPVLAIDDSSNVLIQKCCFKHSFGRAINLRNVSRNATITNCTFVNGNIYFGFDEFKYYGTAVAIFIYKVLNVFTISNCYFNSNKGAKSIIYVYKRYHSKLIGCITYLINSNFYNNEGASIYVSGHHHILHLTGEVVFQNNIAEDGAGVYISGHSIVMFGKNSITKFVNNSVRHNGAAIFLNENSSAIVDHNSAVTFNHNKASNGTIYSKHNSSVMLKATSNVTFSGNLATQCGAAIYSSDNSQVLFTGNATAYFNNNIITSSGIHLQHGGTILSESNSRIIFEENSFTLFSSNNAGFGAAMLSTSNSNIIFKGSSKVMFNNNIVHYCGVLVSTLFSNIMFTDNTNVTYDTNIITSNYESTAAAGIICTLQATLIIFSQHSLVTFINNKADRCGAVIVFESNVIMEEYSTVIFNNNFALYSSGGAFVCSNNSNVTIKGNSNVTFNNNKASQSGGAIYSYNMCRITFKDNSASTFISNTARSNGGAIFSSQTSEISFQGNTVVTFDSNTADNGGVFHFTNSTVIFKESSVILFCNNKARQSGGVGNINFNSQAIFEGITTVRFINNIAKHNAGVLYSVRSKVLFKGSSTIIVTDNKATFSGGGLYFDYISDVSFSEFTNIKFHHNTAFYGGAILANDHSSITVAGNSVLLFVSNEVLHCGGAVYVCQGNFIITQNINMTFDYNKALEGGALCINDRTDISIKKNSIVLFYSNLGTVAGGAVKVLNDSSITLEDHINIKFTNNNAQYGGAIFLDTTSVMVNSSYKNCINFTNNIAKVLGNSVYQDASNFCNSSCLSDRLVGISSEFIATPPNELKFYDPAVCIDNDNDTQCNSYYVQNTMLGTRIVIPACVLDYYSQPVDSTQFLVRSEVYSNYTISGTKQILISCDTFEGISIMGNQSLSKSINFSINITLNIAVNSNWKQILVNLIIELSPCHPGFWQYPKSERCECYNASDIVFCSGSSSTIKRGYWFGNVTGKPAITFCPINYCNFTCCETSNGYYHLSPVRDNQCRSHRSGAACGRCEEGYTLSFDSVECVHVKECSIGYTILVLILVVLYWIIIIVAVFSLMHFKAGIGYLYAITYYYSVVDLLLSQNWYQSGALYTTINVMSSVAKIIPQFLGQFCFITNMSGIDQQFIHYTHPVAISLFLVMITVLARRSHRLSSFISKGIIRVICCLLLLSYTSLATTSLLLMRPLIFHDVDKVYTYVSPDVEYFYGRHLVYGIVAVLFTIVIVIGLPLLLALEPFMNSKINFIRIKPLLDQFQGCYKDKYRCFAAYYMICRLLIVTIVLINSFNDLLFQYLLITICIVIAILHQLFRPYSSSLLNKFDGFILQFLALVSVPPLAKFQDNFDSSLVVVIMFVLVVLPSLVFITISLMLNKEKFEKLFAYCYSKYLQLWQHNEIPSNEIPLIVNEGSSEFYNIIDDSKRINATICDV